MHIRGRVWPAACHFCSMARYWCTSRRAVHKKKTEWCYGKYHTEIKMKKIGSASRIFFFVTMAGRRPELPISWILSPQNTTQTNSSRNFDSALYDVMKYLWTGYFFTGPALKDLSMELVPPNKEIDWFCHKSSKYGTGPTQEKKMTGSAQHIQSG